MVKIHECRTFFHRDTFLLLNSVWLGEWPLSLLPKSFNPTLDILSVEPNATIFLTNKQCNGRVAPKWTTSRIKERLEQSELLKCCSWLFLSCLWLQTQLNYFNSSYISLLLHRGEIGWPYFDYIDVLKITMVNGLLKRKDNYTCSHL